MITQTVTVKIKESQNIIIGRRGTYDTEQIAFDVSELASTYGNGVAVVMVKRPVDTTAYPVTTTTDGNLVTWAVSETDTSYKGHGELEIFWYVNDGLAKSVIYGITILRDIGETTETPPDPYETWIDTLTDLGAGTLQNAQDAETAQSKAEDAQEAAEAALAEFTNPTASATTLAAGSQATASYSNGNFAFGIPQGDKGDNGFSPTITSADITGGHRLTITDNVGTQTVDVMNGEKGDPGQPGQDYVLTLQDKQDIANIVLADFPTWTGGSY